MDKRKTGLTTILAVIMFTIVLVSSLSTFNPKLGKAFAQTTEPLQTTLIQIALADLRAEYDALITGNTPSQQLAAQYDGTTRHEITSAQRASSAQLSAQSFASVGISYVSADINLTPIGTRDNGTYVFLDASEHTTFHISRQYSDDSAPKQTETVVLHTFVYSSTSNGYQLKYDSTGCDSYGYHNLWPNGCVNR